MNKKILPAFKDNSYAIACSSSIEYAPYLSVYLCSIKEYASKDNKYDIIILENSWPEYLRKKFQIFFNANNFSVRFVNPESFFEGIDLYITHSYFKRECYYRLAAPQILNCYTKILVTDIDLIVLCDINNIFYIDMQSNTIAASIEPMYKKLYDDNRYIDGVNIYEYTNNILKINPKKYYNTGVMIIDVEKYIKRNSFSELIKLIKENHFPYQEQCALNMFFNNEIATLPIEWNYEADPSIFINSEYYKKYIRKFSDIKICHFLGRCKPWYYPDMEWSEVWWCYARKTPFYEEILARMINFKYINYVNGDITKIYFVVHHTNYFRLKKLIYKIKKIFTFGKRNERYQYKYFMVKKLLNEAKKIKKQLMKV